MKAQVMKCEALRKGQKFFAPDGQRATVIGISRRHWRFTSILTNRGEYLLKPGSRVKLA